MNPRGKNSSLFTPANLHKVTNCLHTKPLAGLLSAHSLSIIPPSTCQKTRRGSFRTPTNREVASPQMSPILSADGPLRAKSSPRTEGWGLRLWRVSEGRLCVDVYVLMQRCAVWHDAFTCTSGKKKKKKKLFPSAGYCATFGLLLISCGAVQSNQKSCLSKG